MPTKRRVALVGARVTAGLIGVVAVVALTGAALLVPWPAMVAAVPSTMVTPVASDQQRVCPGPLLTLAEDSTQADAATSVGGFTTVYSARASGAAASDAAVQRSDLSAVDNSLSARDGSPVLLSVPVEDGAEAAPLVAGAQSQTAGTETLGGLAAAACTEASSDSWLVSGSTDVGRTSLVLLSNPTKVVASVNLAVFGEGGRVDAPGSTGILVQPGTQRVVSLAGLAPNLRSPVVHVTATGGQVAAALQQSLIRGIQPSGVELTGPTMTPSATQTIPGVVVTTPGGPTSADDGAVADGTPSVRVLIPGDSAATVSVGVQSEDGASTGTSLEVEIQPGVSTEIPLPGLAPGNYTVRVNADEPLVSAVVTTTQGTVSPDFAWASSAAPQAGDFLVSVPDAPSPVLHLANTSADDASLTLTSDSGQEIALSVPAGQSGAVPIPAAGRYLVGGGAGIVASVSYSGDGVASSFTLNPIGPLAAAIPVYSH